MGDDCMKIGEFAGKHNITIDTIRYYKELMLIIPEKVKGQFDYNEECARDLEEILWLKSGDFSINEIQRIFTLKRLTNLNSDEDLDYYKTIFENKRAELIIKREKINEIIKKIEKKILSANYKKESGKIKLGVPLDFLNILACSSCGKVLKLHRAVVEDNLVLDGKLRCSCGFEAEIIDGIILIESDYKKEYNREYTLEGHFIEKTSSEFVNLLYKSAQWIMSKLELNNKILMEPGTGSGLFLTKLCPILPENSLYVCVDHDLDLVKLVKENVEKYYNEGSFIFICCDFLDIPIKDGSVDIVVDHFGTSNYNFTKEGYLINIIGDKVKKGGKWIGDYFNFKEGAKSLQQYPINNRKYFYLKNIIEALGKSKFKTIEMQDMGFTEKGGILERFFVEGEKLYNFVYYGEKVE
jgi:DNA-binding transcriptional MerR regulator